jgi:hypothetical protein
MTLPPPPKVLSIGEIFNVEKATYEVPIYQRNLAWEKEEILALIQDVYDVYATDKARNYYIGTLVLHHKDGQVYEVIDGQQRLTVIYLILRALGLCPGNKLTYRARKKSNDTMKSIPQASESEKILEAMKAIPEAQKDSDIVEAFQNVMAALNEIPKDKQEDFKNFFQENVHLIHYQVPEGIDLNHYYEIMNSRGEQLEKHEVIKARLIAKLVDKADQATFNNLWESCSEMDVYIQQKYNNNTTLFGETLSDFMIKNLDDIPKDIYKPRISINDLIDPPPSVNVGHPAEKTGKDEKEENKKKENEINTFQPIIDFPNFLLIVLKLTLIRIEGKTFDLKDFHLDDKKLIDEFDKVEDKKQLNEDFVKKEFGVNLLKAKYFLDNYFVHHSNEDDANPDDSSDNPWKLQRWQISAKGDKSLKNLCDEKDTQHKLVHLLSMFEVSFSAKRGKNYLFYCLFHLFDDFDSRNRDVKDVDRHREFVSNYCEFVSNLAKKYFYDVYLEPDNLNSDNTPKQGIFDNEILKDERGIITTGLNIELKNKAFGNVPAVFKEIYGDGENDTDSDHIPLFIFNYLDYKLWLKYARDLRGKKIKKGDKQRETFFRELGCVVDPGNSDDFGLDFFDDFYFSRTRNSLEHYYPTTLANGETGALTPKQINCLGNYAYISGQANSSGSGFEPHYKLSKYYQKRLDKKQVGVASIKFRIMLWNCQKNQEKRVDPRQAWIFKDIQDHQQSMLAILSPTAIPAEDAGDYWSRCEHLGAGLKLSR